MRKLCTTLFLLFTVAVTAQGGGLEGLKSSLGKNKQALAQYTWQETQTVSVDGEVKKTTVYSVSLDAEGQPRKTVVSEQDAPQKDARGPLRRRIKGKKVAEMKDYMQQVAQLAEGYAHPDPQKLEAAFKGGNLSISNSGGAMVFTVKSYLKPNDSMVITFDDGKKTVRSVEIGSYLDSPDDKVTINSSFALLPDGTNHVDQSTIVGEQEDVTVTSKNTSYSKR